jgi:hypothetical protein
MGCSPELEQNFCKVKIADNRNSCYGTVTVRCGGDLTFMVVGGQYQYCTHERCDWDENNGGSDDDHTDDGHHTTTDDGRLLESDANEKDATSLVADVTSSSFLGEGVEGATTTTSNSLLRGTKGSKRIL